MHWVVGAGGAGAIGASNMRDWGVIDMGFPTVVGGWGWKSLVKGPGRGSCGGAVTGSICFTGSGGIEARLGSRLVMKTACWAWYCLRGGSLVGVVVVVIGGSVLAAWERSGDARMKRVVRDNIFGGGGWRAGR